MLVSVIACLCATIAVLGWIGWRYFVVPMPSHGSGAAILVEPAAGSDSRSAETSAATEVSNRNAYRSLWLALLLVSATAAGVLTFSGSFSLDPLRANDMVRQKHIQAALRPEALVPPPPLPPSTFIGTERPGLETANRDWARLDPDFMNLALRVFARMEARGYPLALLEGYRSPDRQDALAESGFHVTNARAFQSKHQYGLAMDVAPVRNGRLVISERDPWAMQAYLALGEEAEKEGLTWGGRWKLRDYGHIESPVQIGQLRSRK
jgi:peptidoglycan L-alanyl-D-glutamate endopeptidase CwlK